jgi:hypothetical protein
MFVVMSVSGWADTVIYSTIPSPLPPNVPSQPYEAVSSAEFGDLISFGGTADLSTVTVAMSNWAYESEFESLGTSTGFDVPLTLNLYDVGAGESVGSLIATQTVDALIPWRPEPTPLTCAPGSNNDYMASDGNCYAGSLSTVTFDFTGTLVPGDIIYGLAFNTADYGADPTGVDGPYDSLNFGLSLVPPSVGSNPLPDTAYWNTTNAGFYTDDGAAGVGTFRQDTGWSPYSGMIEFDGTSPVPEPKQVIPITLLLAMIGFAAYRRSKGRGLET